MRLDASSLTSSTGVSTTDKGVVHNSGGEWKLTDKGQEVLELIEQAERCFKYACIDQRYVKLHKVIDGRNFTI